MSARILLFDIETAPLAGYFWGMWKQNIPYARVREEWYMLTWAAKWLDEEEIMYDSNHLHRGKTDKAICKSLHGLLDEADIVVAHNGNRFDIPKVNTRFISHGMSPPSPFRKIDTLKEARKHFNFTSNRLDTLGEILGLGRKVENAGWELWEGCMNGDPEAYEQMVEYNIGDITLLEDVYLTLRPWMSNHPNVSTYDEAETPQCPKCGGEHIHWRGKAHTQAGSYHRFQCQDCGGWGRARRSDLSKEKRDTLLNNISG